jgi:PAS domain S-box-containing protein
MSAVRAAAGAETIEVEGLWAVFRHSTNPMLLADDRRVYVDANEAASQLLGVPRESIIGNRIDDFTPEEQQGSMEEAWLAFLAAGSLAGVFELAAAGGRRVLVDYNATANILPGRHLSIFVAVPEGDEPNPLPPVMLGHAAPHPDATTGRALLTPREREVLEQLALGRTGTETAQELGISPETVRVHVRNAMRRLGARTRVQAIGLALARGEIGMESDRP